MMKRCLWCEREREEWRFGYSRRAHDKRMKVCMACVDAGVFRDPAMRAEYRRKFEAARAFEPKRVAQRDAYTRTEAYRNSVRDGSRRWREKNPEKYRAHNALNNAVRKGNIIKPDRCSCGRVGRLHAHHEDYNRPLEVRWMCNQCHEERHHGSRVRAKQMGAEK